MNLTQRKKSPESSFHSGRVVSIQKQRNKRLCECSYPRTVSSGDAFVLSICRPHDATDSCKKMRLVKMFGVQEPPASIAGKANFAKVKYRKDGMSYTAKDIGT